MMLTLAVAAFSLAISYALVYHLGYLRGHTHAYLELSRTDREKKDIEELDAARVAAIDDYKRAKFGINVDAPPTDN